MGTIAKLSDGGKLNIPAQIRREVGLEKGGPVMVSVVDREIRIRSVRDVLAELQHEARRVFGGDESVERFLRDRRAEATREGELS